VINSAKLDSVVNALGNSDRFMGTIEISRAGNVIYSKTVGFADISNVIPLNQGTKYRIGSISKIFTATMILKAVEENRLSLDQKLSDFFPNIKNSEKITIRQMLNHHSGIHSITDNADYLEWNTKPLDRKEIVDLISRGDSEFEPGVKGKYSNSNYILLSYILERVYHKSYGKVLSSIITRPLGLSSTYYGAGIKLQKDECYSYRYTGKWMQETETDPSIPIGAGAIVSNPSDLNKFIVNLFAHRIISEKSLMQMSTFEGNYGLGMFPFNYHGKSLYGHTGGIDGFTSILFYSPEDMTSFAITSNGASVNLSKMLVYAINCCYNYPFSVPVYKKMVIKPEELDKYLGIYSSKQIPIKITFSKRGNSLIGQGTGQREFYLEASERDKFCSLDGEILLEFRPESGDMTLKQGGMSFLFTLE